MPSHVDTRTVGFKGEDRACSFLKEKGYTIIERNFHVPTGEIDIIVLKCQ
ncbi:MAG: YraN family protein, partial [Treponema sp.]|nr:YraN family protein [Treponema sp.]